jgi:hypothetical protein
LASFQTGFFYNEFSKMAPDLDHLIWISSFWLKTKVFKVIHVFARNSTSHENREPKD